MKVILLILDGLADRSQAKLGGKTPLQAADLPNMDELARRGSCGHMYTVGAGICPGSDIAHWHILGYGEHPYQGRSAIEAAGAGIRLSEDDVVFTVNLATTTVEGGHRYVQAAPAHLPGQQVGSIIESLSEYEPEFFPFRLHHAGGSSMLLVLSGASRQVTDSDPLFYQIPVIPFEPLEGSGTTAAQTAVELTRFTSWCAEILGDHPVNKQRSDEGMTAADYVLIKWGSKYPSVPGFHASWGFRAAVSASERFYAGLADVLEMDFLASEPISFTQAGQAEKDLSVKTAKALQALRERNDFVLVHTKAPDEAAHTGRPARKVQVCAELDRALTPLIEVSAMDKDVLLVVTADHATPSGGSFDVIHSGESVPVVMVGGNVRVDDVDRFDELSCVSGSLGQLTGSDVMPLVLNFTDRSRFGTSRLTPADLPYRPEAGFNL